MFETVLLELARFAHGEFAREIAIDDVFVLDVLAIHGRKEAVSEVGGWRLSDRRRHSELGASLEPLIR